MANRGLLICRTSNPHPLGHGFVIPNVYVEFPTSIYTAFPFRSYPASIWLVLSCKCKRDVTPSHSRTPCSGPDPSEAKSIATLLSGVWISLCKHPLFGASTEPVQLVVYTGPFVFATKLYTNTFSGLDPLVSPPITTTCAPSCDTSVSSMKLMAEYSLNWCTVAVVTEDPLMVPIIM